MHFLILTSPLAIHKIYSQKEVQNMKMHFLLIIILLAAGCASQNAQTAATAKKSQTTGQPTVTASISGGDGSSIEKAVIIKAPDNFVGVRVEHTWITKNYPKWKLEKQGTFKAGNKIYDKMIFSTSDGQQKILYFDITDFYGKLK
jgi:uncharacterized lipoprotein YajG